MTREIPDKVLKHKPEIKNSQETYVYKGKCMGGLI